MARLLISWFAFSSLFIYYDGNSFCAGLPDQGRQLELSDRVPRAMRADNTMDDIFCMVKEKMASDGLCQAPLLVMPGVLIEKSRDLLKMANDPQCPLRTCQLEKERRDEIRVLQRAIQQDFPHMSRAVAFYSSMLNPNPVPGCVPQINFLRHARTDGRRDWGNVSLGQRPRGPKPYELQVVFHRAHV